MHVKKIIYYFASTLLACISLSLPVHAQDIYPTKQIRMVMCCVGAIDAVARAIANEMSKELGQSVVVEPKPGAGGGIATNYVAKSKNDGYTILVGTNATHAANQSLYLDLPYDYIKDFSPIGGIGAGVMVLLVPATSPIHSVAELTARAKREPGKLTYGWAGTTPRIAMALYSQLAHIRLMEIPYKTNPQATTDLIGGQFDTMFADLNTSAPLVKAGKLRALAVSGPRRAQVLPDVPTMQEAGVANYSLTWWVGMWAPAGTPRSAVGRLNAALTKAIASERLAKLFRNTGADPMPMSPDDLMKFQIAENKKWAKIVKNAGITPQ
ncbi:tripartite tricarboxylate transporter substrate binding protein [Paralcaligenes sp. KSB-10]|uniref:Bug family tripartite tricarboxylate transporter substrate binding protein n=1 Tax=Paralcaligenes sp. KSB-10 TaxID=2901142 RepID=UPI001E366726|nr:tripartite tricarboxylate transporter substrate binding protein [Paralcaligenes sp. KSB-10]UHL64669.1 tripartite tricarboxylate transporter substrate binding protein [Paralcaligenes sp. KSB-10]